VILGQALGEAAQLPPAQRKGVVGSHALRSVRQADGLETHRPVRVAPVPGHL
jgi:hypothetical protein